MTEPTRRPRRRLGKRDGLFQKNGWWWVDYYDADGRRHREKAAPDYETAKFKYREIRQRIAKGEVLGIREEGIRLKEFVERVYWPRIKPRLSPAWAERVDWILQRVIIPRFGSVRLSALRADDFEAWVGERLATVGASSFNKELWLLKNLCNRAQEWRYLRVNPAQTMKRIKEPRGRVRYLSREERVALLQEANTTLRLYVLMATQTGARRSELVRLRWADVDMKTRTLTFRDTKNGDCRSVPMTDSLRDLLQTLPRHLDSEAPVLPERDPLVLTRAFSRLVKRVGLKNLTFHDLRHDAASTLAMAGVPLRTISEILGHRDGRMTYRYAHLAPST